MNPTETATEIEPETFAGWLRNQVASYRELADAYESSIPSWIGLGHSPQMVQHVERQVWLSRRIAALCQELADEAQFTRATSPDDLDEARFRFWEQEQLDRAVPGEDPSPLECPTDYASRDQGHPRPHPMAAMQPGRRPAPVLDRPSVDDEIDHPF